MQYLLSLFRWVPRLGGMLRKIFQAVKGSRFGKWIIFYVFYYMGGLVEKFLKVLGISFVVNKYLTPQFTSWFAGKFVGLDPRWVSFLKLVQLDSAITVVLSAMAIAAADSVAVKRRSDDLNSPL